MEPTLRGVDRARLERSCGGARDAIRLGPPAPGIQRAAVRLSGRAFEPHRHDTYAVGMTTAGVQTFRYRGARRVCLPGQLHVLHPDEEHDGAAGTDDGFAYRILYVAPELVRDALGGGALPFVADPVVRQGPATAAVAPLLDDVDEPLDELAGAELAAALAGVLAALGDATRARRRPGDRRGTTVDLPAMERVRERIAADPRIPAPASELEAIAGLDRFAIARQFRRAFGTSPGRYRTLRRLDLARAAIERGEPLAAAAAEAGFADQSHLTRRFKRAYGMTPGRWSALRALAVRRQETTESHEEASPCG